MEKVYCDICSWDGVEDDLNDIFCPVCGAPALYREDRSERFV